MSFQEEKYILNALYYSFLKKNLLMEKYNQWKYKTLMLSEENIILKECRNIDNVCKLEFFDLCYF